MLHSKYNPHQYDCGFTGLNHQVSFVTCLAALTQETVLNKGRTGICHGLIHGTDIVAVSSMPSITVTHKTVQMFVVYVLLCKFLMNGGRWLYHSHISE